MKGPLLVAPAKDDPAEVFDPFVAVLQKKSFGDKVVHHRFDDVMREYIFLYACSTAKVLCHDGTITLLTCL